MRQGENANIVRDMQRASTLWLQDSGLPNRRTKNRVGGTQIIQVSGCDQETTENVKYRNLKLYA